MGKIIIEEILKILSKKYYSISQNTLKKDMGQLYGNMSRIGILDWKTENPFLFKREVMLDEIYGLRICSEEDFRDLYSFYQKLFENKFTEEEYLIYLCPYVIDNEYDEISLRQKIFSYTEDFFVLTRQGEINGVLSVKLPTYPSQSSSLRTCIVPIDFFESIKNYAFDTLPYISVMPVSKMKFFNEINKFSKSVNIIEEFLLRDGFENEGICKNEIGFGHDIKILGKSYDENSISKINHTRSVEW